MAAIDQLTIQGSNVVNDLHDRRITTTAITTCTHILASQAAGLTSIAPITAANLASVLGGVIATPTNNFDTALETGFHTVNSNADAGFPQGAYEWGILVVIKADNNSYIQQYIPANNSGIYVRQRYWSDSWGNWTFNPSNIPSFYKDYSTLAELKAALDAL